MTAFHAEHVTGRSCIRPPLMMSGRAAATRAPASAPEKWRGFITGRSELSRTAMFLVDPCHEGGVLPNPRLCTLWVSVWTISLSPYSFRNRLCTPGAGPLPRATCGNRQSCRSDPAFCTRPGVDAGLNFVHMQLWTTLWTDVPLTVENCVHNTVHGKFVHVSGESTGRLDRLSRNRGPCCRNARRPRAWGGHRRDAR